MGRYRFQKVVTVIVWTVLSPKISSYKMQKRKEKNMQDLTLVDVRTWSIEK